MFILNDNEDRSYNSLAGFLDVNFIGSVTEKKLTVEDLSDIVYNLYIDFHRAPINVHSDDEDDEYEDKKLKKRKKMKEFHNSNNEFLDLDWHQDGMNALLDAIESERTRVSLQQLNQIITTNLQRVDSSLKLGSLESQIAKIAFTFYPFNLSENYISLDNAENIEQNTFSNTLDIDYMGKCSDNLLDVIPIDGMLLIQPYTKASSILQKGVDVKQKFRIGNSKNEHLRNIH